MSKAAKSAKTGAPPRRDYDRRKRKGAIRRSSGRPIWRQPLLLGLAVLLLGMGGAGGWWAWKQGWLVEAQKPGRRRLAQRRRRDHALQAGRRHASRAATMSSATRSWRR